MLFTMEIKNSNGIFRHNVWWLHVATVSAEFHSMGMFYWFRPADVLTNDDLTVLGLHQDKKFSQGNPVTPYNCEHVRYPAKAQPTRHPLVDHVHLRPKLTRL